MAVAPKPAGNSNQGSTPTPAPTAAPLSPTMNTITGTFAGLKAPAVNGIAVLSNNSVLSFTAAAPQGTPSSALPAKLQAVHLVGDLTNGVAVADTKSIYYMTGVGVAGANWNAIAAPKGMTNIVAMCGDLVNGLVVTDGTNLYAWTFSGSSANEWVPLAQLPVLAQQTHWATQGWSMSTSSISRGETFSPPRLMISFRRPVMVM